MACDCKNACEFCRTRIGLLPDEGQSWTVLFFFKTGTPCSNYTPLGSILTRQHKDEQEIVLFLVNKFSRASRHVHVFICVCVFVPEHESSIHGLLVGRNQKTKKCGIVQGCEYEGARSLVAEPRGQMQGFFSFSFSFFLMQVEQRNGSRSMR